MGPGGIHSDPPPSPHFHSLVSAVSTLGFKRPPAEPQRCCPAERSHCKLPPKCGSPGYTPAKNSLLSPNSVHPCRPLFVPSLAACSPAAWSPRNLSWPPAHPTTQPPSPSAPPCLDLQASLCTWRAHPLLLPCISRVDPYQARPGCLWVLGQLLGQGAGCAMGSLLSSPSSQPSWKFL